MLIFVYLVLTGSLCGCYKTGAVKIKSALTFPRNGLQEVTAQRSAWGPATEVLIRTVSAGLVPGESIGCARRIWASQPISPADTGSSTLPENQQKRPAATGQGGWFRVCSQWEDWDMHIYIYSHTNTHEKCTIRKIMIVFILHVSVQSGFHPLHSTDTALVKVLNYFLPAFDSGAISTLLLFDL